MFFRLKWFFEVKIPYPVRSRVIHTWVHKISPQNMAGFSKVFLLWLDSFSVGADDQKDPGMIRGLELSALRPSLPPGRGRGAED